MDCNVPSNRTKFFVTYCRHQTWSLPDSMIYYITKNPASSKCYEKVIQSCKYFFIQNSILVISSLSFECGNNQWNAVFNGKHFDLDNLKCKMWMSNELKISNPHPSYQLPLSPIISKIYQSDIKKFEVIAPNILFKDFVLLASKCEKIFLPGVAGMDEDGSVVGLEKIVEVLPYAKDLHYWLNSRNGSKIITSKTVKELIKIPQFSKLDYFRLCGIPETFDIDSFYGFLKKNKTTKISLEFCNPLSEQYQTHLQVFVDEIIATQNHNYKPPYIFFAEIDGYAFETLWKLYH